MRGPVCLIMLQSMTDHLPQGHLEQPDPPMTGGCGWRKRMDGETSQVNLQQNDNVGGECEGASRTVKVIYKGS